MDGSRKVIRCGCGHAGRERTYGEIKFSSSDGYGALCGRTMTKYVGAVTLRVCPRCGAVTAREAMRDAEAAAKGVARGVGR